MEMPANKSFERIGFAAMAAFTLAPVLFHSGWLLVALAMGVQGDALAFTMVALAVTGGAVAAHIFFKRQILIGSIGLASAVGIVSAFVIGTDLPSKMTIALAFVILAGLVSGLIFWLGSHLPRDIDGLAKQNKVKAGLLILLAAFTIFQTARLSSYMGDAKRSDLSVMPGEVFLKTHSCLTAYVHAVQLAKAGEQNLYDVAHWPDENEIGPLRGKELSQTGPYAPFYLDGYMYPPQFLLLPHAILSVSDDFLVQRALWFGLCGLMLALSFWIVALWVGEQGKRQALWLIPLLWSSLVVMVTLQVGNVHHVVVAMAVLAMIAFDRQRPALGGGLLAFAIVSKVSPGILVVVLLVQRRWRDLAWTLGFGVFFTLLSILFFGIQPVQSFLGYQLPRLLSGDSMRWFSHTDTNIAINAGPFGIPFKLSLLGMAFDDAWGTARLINMVFTVALLGLTVWASLQKRDRLQNLYLWLGVLTLSALQSPFAPGYVIMPMVWMLTLMAMEVKKTPMVIAFIGAWLLITVNLPGAEAYVIVYSFVQLLLTMGLIVFSIFRGPRQLSRV